MVAVLGGARPGCEAVAEANTVDRDHVHRREGARTTRSNAIDLDVTFTTPSAKAHPGAGVLGRGQDLEGPVRLDRRSAVHTYITSCTDREDKGLERREGSRGDSSLPGRQPALPSRPDSRRGRPAALSSMPTARRSSGWATPGGWGSASGCSGPRSSGRWPRIAGQKGFTVDPDRGRAVSRHAGLRPARPERGGLPVDRELSPDSPRVLRSGR